MNRHEAAKERARKLLERDPDFYKKLASKGGSAPHITRSYLKDRKLAATAGKKGGKASKRRQE